MSPRTVGAPGTACGECILFGAIEGMADGLILVDRHGRVFHLNRRAQQILAADPPVPPGTPISWVLEQVGLSDFWRSAVRLKNPVTADIPFVAGATLRVTVSRCRSATGDLIGHALLLRDVTRERKVQIELSDQVARRLLDFAGQGKDASAAAVLTGRETQILKLVAAGLSNAEIGARLHVSMNTVATHLKHLYAKIRVKSRSQASAYAVRHGFHR